MCVFISGFAWGWGPLAWLVCSEIQPLCTRSAGQSITTFVQLMGGATVGQTFLSLLCSFKYGAKSCKSCSPTTDCVYVLNACCHFIRSVVSVTSAVVAHCAVAYIAVACTFTACTACLFRLRICQLPGDSNRVAGWNAVAAVLIKPPAIACIQLIAEDGSGLPC